MGWTLLATDIAGLAAGITLLWGSRRARRAGLLEDVARLGLLAAALLLIGELLTLLPADHVAIFAAMRMATHVAFVVIGPLAVARGAQQLIRRPRRLAHGLLLLAVALPAEGIYAWATRVEPFRLQVVHHTLETEALQGSAAPIRVVVLADLQTDRIGPYEEKVFARIAEARPDLLLLPGDVIQVGDAGDYEDIRQRLITLLADLPRPRLGTYLVGGNVDPPALDLSEAGVTRVDDTRILLDPGSQLSLQGLSIGASYQDIAPLELAALRASGGLTIVMGHSPDFAAPWVSGEISDEALCVAGHTHGGQIVVPGLGAPFTLSRLPRRYASGIHRLGDATLVVSRGVGHERGHAPRVRLFCPPELIVIDLVAP